MQFTPTVLPLSLIILLLFTAAIVMGADSPYDDMEEPVLEVHNSLRTNYSADPLKWNDTLAKSSQEYAEECKFEHSGADNVGENLAAGYDNATAAVLAWANEQDDYDDGKITKKTGHFTQMVWKNTTTVGCGWKDCDDILQEGVKQVLLVCQYSPQGNYEDEDMIKENVGEDVVNSAAGGGRIGTLRKVWRSVWGVGAVVVVWSWLQ